MATTEERLAALEAKLAQLTDTRPTTYYTHQYSGEEIDAATGRALTGGALDTSVTNVSNQLGTFVRPNLLDNWYFGRPVNQRGQTEYTGNVYGLDRWRSWDGDNSILSLTEDGYRVGGIIYQYSEPKIYDYLFGKIVTLSILFADGALYAKSAELKHSDWYALQINTHGIANMQFGINNSDFSNLNNNFFRIIPSAIGTLSDPILAVKLELGPTQTLAHQDAAGNWVLNEVPKYSRELLDCQRYYVKFGYADKYCILGNGVARDGTFVSITMPVPAELRANPVVILAGTIVIRHSDGVIQNCTTVSCDAFGVSSILLKIQASGLTPGDAYEAFLAPGNYLHVGCDL